MLAVAHNTRNQTQFPPQVRGIATEISTPDRERAFIEAWHELRSKEAAIWHRPANSPLHDVGRALESVAAQLPERVSLKEIVGDKPIEAQVNTVISGSPIAPYLDDHLRSTLQRELTAIVRTMREMVASPSGNRAPPCVLDLRVEHKRAFIEQYHQDIGTALLMTLVGPGTHFVTHDNLPTRRRGTFSRDELQRPDEVYEVSCRDLLFMHGVSGKPRGLAWGEPSGLWHSSPPKWWQGKEQWSSRILIVAASPISTIRRPLNHSAPR